MIRHLKAVLCAVVALCAASPAVAASYVTYTIGGTANSIFGGPTSWFIAEFTIPVDQIRGGGTFYDVFNQSFIGAGTTSIGASSTGLTFEQRGRIRSDSRVFLNTCLTSPASTLPITAGSISVDPSCSSADIVLEGVGNFEYTNAKGGVDSLTVAISNVEPRTIGLSSFVMAVPEPSTWALMLAGFGMVGYSLRRRRHHASAVAT